MSKSTEESTVKNKKFQNLILWKPGQSGNPKGYPKGQRHYRTIYLEALKRIAKETNYSVEDVEDAMTTTAIMKAIKGDFYFYQEVHNRIHGKPKEKLDLGVGGGTLADLLTAVSHGGKRKASSKATRKNKK